MTEVLAIGKRSNNAQLIEEAAQLGYLDGLVIDLTYGEGKFWTRFRPDEERFVTNDLHKPAELRLDFCDTRLDAERYDAVVFDPPYKLAGRRDTFDAAKGAQSMDSRYGTGGSYVPIGRTAELIDCGTREACRISRRFVLVKCMDQVASGRIHWQTDDVTATAKSCGFRKLDSLILPGGRKQSPKRRQVHARRNYSTLLVFVRETKRKGKAQ